MFSRPSKATGAFEIAQLFAYGERGESLSIDGQTNIKTDKRTDKLFVLLNRIIVLIIFEKYNKIDNITTHYSRFRYG